MSVQWGNLIVLLPLLGAFVYIVRRIIKNLTTDLWVNLRGVAYVIVAVALVRWFMPPLGVAGSAFGLILSSVLSLLIVLAIVQLPAKLDKVDDLLWKGLWFDPWKRTGNDDDRVPYVRWGRRIALLAFGLFVAVVALGSAIVGPSEPATATDNDRDNRPAATAPAAPATTSTPAAPAPATTAPSGSPANTIVNNCGGPTPVAVEPTTIKFGTQNLQVCYNGSWQNWPANVVAPTTVKLTAWAKDGTYGYGVAVVGSDSYLFRTTEFK